MAPPRVHTGWDDRIESSTGIANHETFEVQDRVSSCGISIDDLLGEQRHVVATIGLGGDVKRIGSVLWEPVEEGLYESVVVLGGLGVVGDVVSSVAVGVFLVGVGKAHTTRLLDKNHGGDFVPRIRVNGER